MLELCEAGIQKLKRASSRLIALDSAEPMGRRHAGAPTTLIT